MDFETYIRCGYVNAQSIVNKSTEIRELINDRKLDIFTLSETWLGEGMTAVMEECTPPTHSFFGRHRREGRGGGVGVFLAKWISHIRVVKEILVDSFEYIQVKFRIKDQWFQVMVVYRPPMTRINDFLVEFDSLLSTLDLITYNTVICGDFNLWMDDSSLPSVDRMNNLLASYNLKNNITTATSSTGHALDLVIDDQEGRLQNINIESRCTFSPVHMMITYNLGYKSQKYRKVSGEKSLFSLYLMTFLYF